jgi:hypothetical protein
MGSQMAKMNWARLSKRASHLQRGETRSYRVGHLWTPEPVASLGVQTAAVLIGLYLFGQAAHAQQLVCWNVSNPVVLCNGQDNTSNTGGVISAPPASFGTLPLKLRRAWVAYNGDAPAGGNISVALDKGGVFIAQTGYPTSQTLPGGGAPDISHVIQLAQRVTKIGQPQDQVNNFDPPVVWALGDKLFWNNACYSPPGIGAPALQMGWSVCFEAP